MSQPTTRCIHIQNVERQADGRWRFTFTDQDGQTKIVTNAAECCSATLCETDDAMFVEVYFESVTGITEDFIFPRSSEGRGSKVERLPTPKEAAAHDPEKIPLPLIRRVMPTIIADDLPQGVSPMTGPHFSIAAARTRECDRLMASGMTFEEALAQVNSR